MIKNLLLRRGGLAATLLLLCLIAGKFSYAQSNPASSRSNQIEFIENSWPEAVKQARAQHKYIFMDTYATWCGPCKMMKATTFKNDKAAAFYNEHFVNLSIDIEKGIGPEMASRLGIQSIPTLIIFDENGNPVSGTVGYINANKLIKFGQEALNKKTL